MKQKVGQYEILTDQMIGQGTLGVVLKCSDNKFQEKICVKILAWNDEVLVKQILQILSKLQSPHYNVIKIYDIISFEQRQYIFMEQCDGDFTSYMKARENYWFGNDEIYDFLSQIVNGYIYLKSLNIIHRDIIPKNILYKKLFDKRVLYKISDFEVGKINLGNSAISIAGAPLYQAPEVFAQQTHYDDKCDVYSLGLILYQLCYQGQMCAPVKSFLDLGNFHERLKMQQFRCPAGSSVDQGLIELVEKMIVYNPNQRISWTDLAHHPKLQPKFTILKCNDVDTYFVDFQKPLGSGMQGATFQAINLKNQQNYCAKRIKNDQVEGMREIQIYQKIKQQSNKNDNIIGIEDIVVVNDDAYLILERCDESIEQYCKKKNFDFNQEEIIDIIRQIVNGYVFLKGMNIIHRDLKPANILVKYQNSKPILKIIDYGVGKIINNSSVLATTQAGTPNYAAPEVLMGVESYDHSCDVFSLGVMAYELIHQRLLICANSMDDLLRKLNALQKQPAKCNTNNNKFSPELQLLIEQMLSFNPKERITWEQLQNHNLLRNKKIKIISVQQANQPQNNQLDNGMPNTQQMNQIQVQQNGSQSFNQCNNQFNQQFFQQNNSQPVDEDLFKPQITQDTNVQTPNSLRGTPHPVAFQNSNTPQQNQFSLKPNQFQGNGNLQLTGVINQHSSNSSKRPVTTFGQPAQAMNQSVNNNQLQNFAMNGNKAQQGQFNSFAAQKLNPNSQGQNLIQINNKAQDLIVPSAQNQFQQKAYFQINQQEGQQNKEGAFQQFGVNQFSQGGNQFQPKQFLPSQPVNNNQQNFNSNISQNQINQNNQFPKKTSTPLVSGPNFQQNSEQNDFKNNNFQAFKGQAVNPNYRITCQPSSFPSQQTIGNTVKDNQMNQFQKFQFNQQSPIVQTKLNSTCFPQSQTPQLTKKLDIYIKKIMELTKGSCEDIDVYLISTDKQQICVGPSYLLFLVRMQCNNDLIKILNTNQIIIEGRIYKCEQTTLQKNEIEQEKSKCVQLRKTKLDQIKKLNQQDQIIKEIINADQQWDKNSGNQNYCFINTLNTYKEFLLKFEKVWPKNQFSLEFQYAINFMFNILEEYPLDQHETIEDFMLRVKQEPEKQEFLARKKQKFF